MTITTINTAGAGTFTVPSDVTSIICRAWGAGGKSGISDGGDGGAFAGHTTAISVTPGQTIYYQVGQGNNVSVHSWANTLANSVPTHRDHGVYAEGSDNAVPLGPGRASVSIGDARYDGGNNSGSTGGGGAGSGGAASGTTGGTPDGANGAASGNNGAQPGGGAAHPCATAETGASSSNITPPSPTQSRLRPSSGRLLRSARRQSTKSRRGRRSWPSAASRRATDG